jgi:hypothetical protein
MAAELEHWHDFYLLLGTAGATLVALLFVAVSLGVGYLTPERSTATRLFMSPVVIHFASVFFVAAISLVPSHAPAFFAGLIGATAVIGILVSAVITVQVVRTDLTHHVSDYFAYGLLPAIGYVALLAAAIMIATDKESGLDLLGGGLLLLLIVNIRNAWDLTLTMVQRHNGSG